MPSVAIPHDSPLTVLVFDKNLKMKFVFEGWTKAEINLHLDAISTAMFTFPLDHPRGWGGIGIGDRVVVYGRDGGHLLSGPCYERSIAEKAYPDATATVTFADDWWLFQRLLGWVQPGKGIDQQASDDSSAQWSKTGPAETVCKALFSANATRYGLPVTVLPDQGRGAYLRAAVRMQPIADVLWPALTTAGVGARIRQVPYGSAWRLEMDCWTLPTRPPIVERGAPQVASWTYHETGPGALKGVVGGQGQGNVRTFRAGVRQDEIDRVGLGYGGEVFNDSRQESTVTGLDRAIADELAQKAWAARSSLELVEAGRWQYGTAWRLGDLIRTRIDEVSPILTTPVVSVSITSDPGDPYRVTSTVDVVSTPLAQRASKVLAQRLRQLQGD